MVLTKPPNPFYFFKSSSNQSIRVTLWVVHCPVDCVHDVNRLIAWIDDLTQPLDFGSECQRLAVSLGCRLGEDDARVAVSPASVVETGDQETGSSKDKRESHYLAAATLSPRLINPHRLDRGAVERSCAELCKKRLIVRCICHIPRKSLDVGIDLFL